MATDTVSVMTLIHLATRKLGLPHVLDFVYPPRCLLCGGRRPINCSVFRWAQPTLR